MPRLRPKTRLRLSAPTVSGTVSIGGNLGDVSGDGTVALPSIVPAAIGTVGDFTGGEITIHRLEISLLSDVLWFTDARRGGSYERFQRLQVLTGNSSSLSFRRWVNAVASAIQQGTYELLIDDVVHTSTVVSSSVTTASFTVDLTVVADGWHKVEARLVGGFQRSAPWFVFFNRLNGTAPAQSQIPVITGTYDLSRGTDLMWAMIPATFDPPEHPLEERSCTVFSDAASRTTLHRRDVVPIRHQNINRHSVTSNGIKSTFNTQNYFFSDLIRKYPPVHLLDGARGVGTLMMPTHIMVDRHGGAYCMDPWRVVRVHQDGTISTRCGYRHYQPGLNWSESPSWDPPGTPRIPEDIELLGDWSAIPEERHGFHEIWGGAFDLNTVAASSLDTEAPQQLNSVNGELEHPHSTGPRLFVADSQNNRILLLTFQKDSFTAEPVVTEFLTGLDDPWDVVWVEDKIYVSERKDHRIVEYNATTGALVRVVVEGAALASVNTSRFVTRLATLDTIRAEDVVAPEGLFYQDDWLYFGSVAMAEVRRVNLLTGVIEVVCRPPVATDLNAHYIKISVSDGSFGPRGTVFVSTFSNATVFQPCGAYLPNTGPEGTRWVLHAQSAEIDSGKDGLWHPLGYSTASGVGQGRLYAGSSEEGLVMLSKELISDPTPNYTQYNSGATLWKERGYRLVYGDNGFGYHASALPWGDHPDIDYFLTWNGHVEP